MKKLLGIVVLGLMIGGNAFGEIIYRNCDLTPNYEPGSIVSIDLELKTIKVYVPHRDGIAIHKIDKAYGDVLISSNLMHTSQMSQEATKSFTDAVHIEMSFDIQNHTISILVGKKPGIPKEFSEHLDKQVEAGNLLFSIQDTCDVENTYDPMKEKKLLKDIGF